MARFERDRTFFICSNVALKDQIRWGGRRRPREETNGIRGRLRGAHRWRAGARHLLWVAIGSKILLLEQARSLGGTIDTWLLVVGATRRRYSSGRQHRLFAQGWHDKGPQSWRITKSRKPASQLSTGHEENADFGRVCNSRSTNAQPRPSQLTRQVVCKVTVPSRSMALSFRLLVYIGLRQLRSNNSVRARLSLHGE